MARTFLAFLPLLLITAGCKAGIDQQVVGSWTSQQGMKLTVAADKTYQTDAGPIKTAGTWKIEGDDVVFAPGTLNGRPISEVKTRLQQNIGRFSGARRTTVEKIIRDIDRSNYVKVDASGKTLTTDSTRDQNENPWSPLTKSSS